jgi:hypothetical protein
MSPELTNYISSLPISTFLLSNNRHLIGRRMGEDLHVIYVNAVCELNDVFGEDDQLVGKMVMPLVPNSFEETSAIYRTHVVLESPASFPLKKAYCDTLLKTKISHMNGLNSLSSLDLETKEPNHKPKNPWSDRWNN